MSKLDGLRAMREAKYEAARAAAAAPRTQAPPRTPVVQPTRAVPQKPAGASPELCGHRSMNGRTCTREHGHSAKSHRYS